LLTSRSLALYQMLSEPCRGVAPDAPEPGPDARFGHHGILVLAENVLNLLGLVDEARRRASDLLRRQLGGVPGALHLDPHGVELRVARLSGQGLHRLAKLLELPCGDPGKGEIRGRHARLSHGFIEAAQELPIARAVQGSEQLCPRAGVLDVKALRELERRRSSRRVFERSQLVTQMLPEDVEVPNGAQRAAEPVELAPKRFHPRAVEARPDGAQDGPESARGRAHLVDVLRIGPAPGAARAVRRGMLLGRQDECRPHQGEDDKNAYDPSIRSHGQRSTAHPVAVELRGARWTGVAVDSIGIGPGISVRITSGVSIALAEI